jgi:DNA-binding SARP family transcriptional activator/Tfp pilus assembly protein PilF
VDVRFQVLGALRVQAGDTEVEVSGHRTRALLAMLLLNPDHAVSVERLVDAVWGVDAPGEAKNRVHLSISRLRARLAAARLPRELIVTEPAGYRIVVDADSLDLLQFRRLRDEAREAAAEGRFDRAGQRYRAAVGLWKGSPLAEVDSDQVRQAASILDDELITTLEECLEAELAAGGGGELVAELTELVRVHPYREKLHRCLMLALYRAGRQADALTAYRHARQVLHEEQGTEPGAELQRLHQAILNRDPDLATAAKPAQPAAPALPKPRELPADVAGFTGRAEALRALDELLPDVSASAPAPVVISAIAGTAGVGKTALAVHWAHRATDRFPDGQLYVNLRGHDPEQPVSPADALARFLGALGVAGQDIPLDIDERAARFRSEVADRRMLLVLDNAGSVEQVRPLLPGSGTCAVLVTSRDGLTGLVARHGARRLELDLLPLADAIELLRRLMGPRVDAEPNAAATLADQCARLPLALRVAAELAAARSATTLSQLVVELGDRQRRLQLLDPGDDPYAAVRVVFSWSIDSLPPDAARIFRLLGLHPGPDFDPYATAALADASLEAARHGLELLTRTHLVHRTGPSRYGMHDLLHAYAAELAHVHDSGEARQVALVRLFDHYRHTAAVAMDAVHPYDRERRPRVPPAHTPTPALSDPAPATAWLDAELPNLLAMVHRAATDRWSEYAWHLSATLHRHIGTRGRYHEANTVHQQALESAVATGNPAAELDALNNLGDMDLRRGRYQQALDYFGRALTVARTTGNRTGELAAFAGLGYVHRMQGRHEQAREHHAQALNIARAIGNRTGELDALNGLGAIYEVLGRYEQALDHHGRALDIARDTGNRVGEAGALTGLGYVHWELGQHEQALLYFGETLAVAQAMGNRTGEVVALIGLGRVQGGKGEHHQAADSHQRALEIAREIGNRNAQFEALHGLGRDCRATGNPEKALAFHHEALQIASELGQPADQARACDGLAHAHRILCRLEQAREYWRRALEILTRLGIDHTEDEQTSVSAIRAHLAALDRPQQAPAAAD